MNKTIIININGIIFHIEEEAYEVLQTYMVDVKRHFGNTADSHEIVSDIENRIAEMFGERLNAQKAVILMDDVKEVCAQMGKVEDFELDEETTEGYTTDSAYREERSLFRDPDDKLLGGVCSGLAHYFGIETMWVRLGLLITILFAGTGLLLYLILWIVIPQAKTRADKMKMRGEPANLENFKRSFHEEMGDVKRNFSAAGERVRTGLNNPNGTLNSFINTIGKIIVICIKIVGIIIIVSLILALVALLATFIFGAGFADSNLFDKDFPLYAVDPQFRDMLMISGFFVIAIPLLVLIFMAIRVLFDRKVMGAYFGFSMLIIWLVAIGFSVYYIAKTAVDFKEKATITQEVSLVPQTTYKLNVRDNNTLIIKKGENLDSIHAGRGIRKSFKRNGRALFNHHNSISLRIEKADPNQAPTLVEEFSAKGTNFDAALERAEKISYEINQEGENLWLASSAVLPTGEMMRDQEVRLTLLLPIGTLVSIPREFGHSISLWGLSFWECQDAHREANEGYRSTEWIMTEMGLKCIITQEPASIPIPIDSLQKDTVVTVNP